MNKITYSPEDNKLRIYVDYYIPKEEGAALRHAGFVWTSKQSSVMSATWAPERQDLALSLDGVHPELQDENSTLLERSAERAERFEEYREKRRDEAHGLADKYESTDTTHGHQSEAKAQREVDRQERTGVRACAQWDKAEYWQSRVSAVISHALYKERPDVRERRIKKIEKHQRDLQKSHMERYFKLNRLHEILGSIRNGSELDSYYQHKMEDFFQVTELNEEQYFKALVFQAFENILYYCYNNETLKQILETNTNRTELIDLLKKRFPIPDKEDFKKGRYYIHNSMRLLYENEMLKNEIGESASIAGNLKPGWTYKTYVIHRVNKSNASGRIISVDVWTDDKQSYSHGDRVTKPGLVNFPLEGVSNSAFDEPTEESKALLKKQKAILKAAKGPGPAKILNLPLDEAKKLQALWNVKTEKDRARWGRKVNPDILEMTQKEYSTASKGAYARAGTVEIIGGGDKQSKGSYNSIQYFPTIARLRASNDRIIVLTDKPASKTPPDFWNDPQIEARKEVESNLEELRQALSCDHSDSIHESMQDLFKKARVLGYAYLSSTCQFGLTEKGKEALSNVHA